MARRIAVLIVSFALVLAVRSDETLKCYMCTSLTNPGCDIDPKAHKIEPVECTVNNMIEWQKSVQRHQILNPISTIFEIDNSQHYQATAPMACAKMTLTVNKQDIIVRNCQTAKTETIDPCKAIGGKVSNDIFNLQHCDLCMEDACNSAITTSPRIFFTLISALGAIVLGSFYNVA
ncbi:PREDICTED: uncharacterized protein LOC108549532 [Eufriesea mexicana]|uniref:uncharacterized protein LOC108549532 n=1 Tax=Eufriesea mexicana TaxID=516756 RepID=UPI00083BCA23|nr:PREDICTED: uncharacterized protein LOC108549532 [Eufriesea mexicana]